MMKLAKIKYIRETIEEMQKHCERAKQLIVRTEEELMCVPSHDIDIAYMWTMSLRESAFKRYITIYNSVPASRWELLNMEGFDKINEAIELRRALRLINAELGANIPLIFRKTLELKLNKRKKENANITIKQKVRATNE